MQNYRSVFISDVHLGTADCQAEYLLDFLNQVRCETLYLVGDSVDLIAMQRRRLGRALHRTGGKRRRAVTVAALVGITIDSGP